MHQIFPRVNAQRTWFRVKCVWFSVNISGFSIKGLIVLKTVGFGPRTCEYFDVAHFGKQFVSAATFLKIALLSCLEVLVDLRRQAFGCDELVFEVFYF